MRTPSTFRLRFVPVTEPSVLNSISLSGLQMDPSSALRRCPPRPVDLRQPGYDDEFDFLTAFYDCFASVDDRWIVLMGPPLANLQSHVIPALKNAFRAGTTSRFVVRELDRHSQIWVRTVKRSADLPPGLFDRNTISVRPNHCEFFCGKKVILTQSKDNDLQWIRDWASFHVRRHGCNAVLIYDNASTRYASSKIEETLASIDGLHAVAVVEWPYKYGPGGNSSDSHFCQYGMLEHARHRFLSLAAGVINADVDELVVTQTFHSIYELVRQSATGYLAYQGTWVENACVVNPGEQRRHTHFVYTSNHRARKKWSADPRRCPEDAQWSVHYIRGMQADTRLSQAVNHRHFRAISTNWKERRWTQERPNGRCWVDETLAKWMRVIRD